MDTSAATPVAVAALPGALPLAGAPRPVRRLAPPEVPWPGSLAAHGDESCFLVDAALLRDWPGWDADPDSHVLGPADLVRRDDGHDVVLPLCTERLVRFLQRRTGRGALLSAGEAVTVLVSILRGTADALARSPFAAGEWWLTDAGKPVFVQGDGPDAAMAADVCLAALGGVLPETPQLRERLGAGTNGGQEQASADLAHPRALAAALPEIEAALFARTAPEPLATTDLAPARARVLGAVTERADDVLAHTGRGRWNALSGFVDSDLREVLAAGWDALRERVRRRTRSRARESGSRASRRRMVLVAGLAGAAVIAVGLLWPHGDPGSKGGAAPGRPVTSPPATASAPARTPTTASPASSTASTSTIATRVQAMLAARIACGDDRACRGSFSEDPDHVIPPGAIDRADQSVELLDDFGGAAVLRVASSAATGRGRSQLVVVVRTDKKWLIRDVTDAADQPG
ncbi:hypothetical protein LK09_11030 [Microbacterium mangrovi]|uniref:Uncharacterized protein n=1 Tax=Microbacterium mangrovi TaxID=1348253 RepID=A0A0B2A6I3_9MICO|nr:hypothetical protein [Microbacterium mangrovi]KHK97333.1 hypothetical protein LK09_11030 [Microbacterium mangrovi]